MSRPEYLRLIPGGNEEFPDDLPKTLPQLSLVRGGQEKGAESRWRRRAKKASIIGAGILAMSGVGLGGGKIIWWDRLDQSGTIIQSQPPQEILVEIPRPIDNELTLMSRNMQLKAGSLSVETMAIIKQEDVDAVGAQEVTAEDEEKFKVFTSNGLYSTIAIGDARQKPRVGWQGNAILTWQQQKNPSAKAIRGTSYFQTIFGTLEGAIVDTALAARGEPTLKNTADGSQEDRVAQAATITAMAGDKTVDIRLINVHIAGNKEVGYIYGSTEMHNNQRNDVEVIIKEELEKNIPIIVMGDFNAPAEEIVPWFSSMGFKVAVTGPTFEDGIQRLDYIAYHPAGLGKSLVLKEVKVLNVKSADHRPLLARFILPKPEKIALKYKRPITPQQEKRDELKLHYRK